MPEQGYRVAVNTMKDPFIPGKSLFHSIEIIPPVTTSVAMLARDAVVSFIEDQLEGNTPEDRLDSSIIRIHGTSNEGSTVNTLLMFHRSRSIYNGSAGLKHATEAVQGVVEKTISPSGLAIARP